MNKVSVIVSCYHRPDELRKFIQRMLGQSYQKWELLVMDEAEDDKNKQVFDEFDDKRLIYKHCERFNDWGYSVKEIGARKSKGSLLCFPADDAEYTPDFLEKMVKGIRGYDLVMCDFMMGNRITVAPSVGKIDVGGFIVRKEWFKSWPNKDGTADGDYITDIVDKGATYNIIRETLYHKH